MRSRRFYLPPLWPGDAKPLLIMLLILIFFVGGTLYFAPHVQAVQKKVNNGFEPGWTCIQPDLGDPICVKS